MEDLGKVRFCLRVYTGRWFTTRGEANVTDFSSYSDISAACLTLLRNYLPMPWPWNYSLFFHVLPVSVTFD